jgi:hypothetical protein
MSYSSVSIFEKVLNLVGKTWCGDENHEIIWNRTCSLSHFQRVLMSCIGLGIKEFFNFVHHPVIETSFYNRLNWVGASQPFHVGMEADSVYEMCSFGIQRWCTTFRYLLIPNIFLVCMLVLLIIFLQRFHCSKFIQILYDSICIP